MIYHAFMSTIIALLLSHPAFAQVERERVEAAFIFKFISFIKGPLPVIKNYKLCILGDDKIYRYLSEELKQSHYDENVPYLVVGGTKPFPLNDCHLLVTGVSITESSLAGAENSIHITKDKKLFDRSVVYLKQSDGKLKFDINYRWAQQNNFKVSARLLQIADYIEK